MLKTFCILAFLGGIKAADLSPLNIVPTVDNGSLAVFDWENRVQVYRMDGTKLGTYSAPGARSVAIGAEGRVAVAARTAIAAEGVLLFGPAGKTRSIEIAKFEATNVCLGADHSVWVMVRPSLDRTYDGSDYAVVRHYSWEGESIGTALLKSTLPGRRDRIEPSEPVTGGMGCRVFGDRVGVYLNYGGRPDGLWVELNLEGRELGRLYAQNNAERCERVRYRLRAGLGRPERVEA